MDENTITVQDLTWSQLKDPIRVWKIDTSKDPYPLELRGREGIEIPVTKNDVVNYLNSKPELGFRNYVADLDPATTQYWTAADQFIDVQIRSSQEESQVSQPNQAQLDEMVKEWTSASAEEKRLAEEFHNKHPEISLYQALQRIRAGEGSMAEKEVRGEREPTRVPQVGVAAEEKISQVSPGRSQLAQRRMAEIQARAAISPESRSFRHDIKGWTTQHLINPFKGPLGILFGRSIITSTQAPTEEVSTPTLGPAEVSPQPRPSAAAIGLPGPAGPGKTAGPAPSPGQKYFGGFRQAAAAGQKVTGAAQKAKQLATLALNAGRALAGDPKALLNFAKSLLDSDVGKRAIRFAKGVGVGAGLGLIFLIGQIAQALGFVGSIAAGAAAGALVGSFIPGVGTVTGAVVGGAFGGLAAWLSGTGLGSALGGLGAGIASFTSSIVSLGATLVGAGGSFLLALSSTVASVAVPIVAIGGSIIVLPALVIIIQMQNNEAFRAIAAQRKLFTVVKTVDKSQLSNNPKDDLTYTVTISTDQDQPVKIVVDDKRILDYKQATGLSTPLTMPDPQAPYPSQVTKNAPVKVTYKPLHVEGSQFNDSIIINAVTVTGTAGDTSESQAASANVFIGNISDPPYGIPISGTITSLDGENVCVESSDPNYLDPQCQNRPGLIYKPHCGEVFHDRNSSQCLVGGLDIAGNGGQTILSTTTGKVTYSQFDCRLGGVIYIDSQNTITGRQYRAAFLHLSGKNLPAKDSVVRRGQGIGVIYDKNVDDESCGSKGLSYETGPHLHYQVLRDGTNAAFADQNNAGSCKINNQRTDFTESTDSYNQASKGYPNSITQTADCSNATR